MRWLQPGVDWYIQAPPPLSAPPPPRSHSWLISWESRRRLRGLLPPHYLFLFSAAPPVAPSSWSGSSGVKSTAPLGVLSSFVGRGQSCVLWSLSASSQGQRSEAATLGRAVSVWQGRLFRRGGEKHSVWHESKYQDHHHPPHLHPREKKRKRSGEALGWGNFLTLAGGRRSEPPLPWTTRRADAGYLLHSAQKSFYSLNVWLLKTLCESDTWEAKCCHFFLLQIKEKLHEGKIRKTTKGRQKKRKKGNLKNRKCEDLQLPRQRHQHGGRSCGKTDFTFPNLRWTLI